MIKHAIRHPRLLESFQGHRMSETVQAELKEFAALSYTKLIDAAFARAKTPEDIRDLLYLFLGGANVSYEPVIGSLSGFETPVNFSAVRRVRMEKPGRLAHKGRFIGMRDTPLSIAEAVREMLSVKERKTELTLTSAPSCRASAPPKSLICSSASARSVICAAGASCPRPTLPT